MSGKKIKISKQVGLAQRSTVKMPQIAEMARVVGRITKMPQIAEMARVVDRITKMPQIAEMARVVDRITKMPQIAEMARVVDRITKMPQIAETARVVELQASKILGAEEALKCSYSNLRRVAENMRTPWLDVQDPLRSDFGAPADFYVSRGFNPALTDFPVPAFEESLNIADLRREPPSLVDLYGSPVPAGADDEKEEGWGRANMAHRWLFRLETRLRRFIDEQMTKAFGADWPKHQLPNGLHEEWQDKKRKSQQSGRREYPLIAYADFTDYVRVICKRDNWRNVFAPFFGREESVRESFQRLYLVRLDTMHARPITQDDKLLLYVETRRLCTVILGKEKS